MQRTKKLSTVVRRVRRLAAKYPKAVYKAPEGAAVCYYNKGKVVNGPKVEGCIVGQAIRGYNPLRDPNDTFSAEILDFHTVHEFDREEEGFDEMLSWLRRVQFGQDGGLSWARAVEAADQFHPNVAKVV